MKAILDGGLPGSALRHAEEGRHVFRLRPRGKKPLKPGWQERATSDPDRVRGLWKARPTANVGMRTGRESGVVVVDVDVDLPEDESKAEFWARVEEEDPDALERLEEVRRRMEAIREEYPTDRIYRSGSGGYLMVYRYPPGLGDEDEVKNRARVGGEAVDVRGDGGYIVLPPSIHPDTGAAYEVLEDGEPGPTAPEFVLNGAGPGDSTEARREAERARGMTTLWTGVAHGGRNDACASLAGSLAGRGVPEEEAVQILLAWNLRNEPPIGDHSDDDEPAEVEIPRTVASIYRKERERREREDDGLTMADLEIWDAGDLMRADLPEPGWVAEGFMPKDTLGIHAGLFDTGKSWFALQIMMDVALGRAVFDHFPVPNPMRSLVLLGEGTAVTTRSRLHLLARAQGVNPEDMEDSVRIVRAPDGIRLGNQGHGELIRQLVREHGSDILWFDPFVEFLGGSEGDDVDLNEAVGFLRRLRDKLGITVQAMHHARQPSDQDAGRPPGIRFRGRTNIVDKADIAYLLEGTGRQDIQLTRAKSRNAIVEESFTLRWTEEETEDGEETFRLVHEDESDVMSTEDDLEVPVARAVEELRRLMPRYGPDSWNFWTNNSTRDGGPSGRTEYLEKAIAKLVTWGEFYVDEDMEWKANQKTVMGYPRAVREGLAPPVGQRDMLEGPGGPR